jgi:mRNA-degrading endonuclease RelE of RelBE toxin-antitoxin system
MKYEIVIARSAQEDFRRLDARWRSSVKAAIRKQLGATPKRQSKSRIKRLGQVRHPQYRLRIDRVRVFYDVNDEQGRVEILGIVMKPQAAEWLRQRGVAE